MKFAALAALAFSSCVPVTDGWNAGWTERAAQDRIMLVRNAPETLGHRRLVYQSAAHPDLGTFLNSRGLPDFIAETSSEDRQYLILYYLDSKRAWFLRPGGMPVTSLPGSLRKPVAIPACTTGVPAGTHWSDGVHS